MDSVYAKYKKMNIDGRLVCLEETNDAIQYFCYPTNAKAIGFEGCIMYCFIEPYGDMVFACNPESCTDRFVYPLAKSFGDFLGLILACGSANPIEQIVWMSREQFWQHLREEEQARTEEQQNLLDFIEKELAISPIENPYDYVKTLQASFDGRGIEYSDDYFETYTGGDSDGYEF